MPPHGPQHPLIVVFLTDSAMLRPGQPLASISEQALRLTNIVISFLTDSQACRTALVKGSSGALRYVRKHQFVSLPLVTGFLCKDSGNGPDRAESGEDTPDLMAKLPQRVLHEKHSRPLGMRC